MSDEIQDAIIENAKGPKRVRGDEGEVEQHDLADQIAAAKHVAGTTAATNASRGLRFTKLIPPGATS